MFRKDPLFIPGWIYFFLMFPLASRLPESFGCENGIIENLQMFWLFGGLILCSAALDHRFQDWGGRPYTLWKAGILYYFLLIMREISWGRTFFPTASGGFISYSEMGLYGKMVHPMVGILLAVLLVLLYRAKVWQALKSQRSPSPPRSCFSSLSGSPGSESAPPSFFSAESWLRNWPNLVPT